MRLFWRIRYLDRTDKQFKDRDLYLSTKTLDAVTRAAVELVAADNYSVRNQREILKYRHLFVEEKPTNKPLDRMAWTLATSLCQYEG